MTSRAVLVAAVLVVTGVVAARAVMTSAPKAPTAVQPSAAPESVDSVGVLPPSAAARPALPPASTPRAVVAPGAEQRAPEEQRAPDGADAAAETKARTTEALLTALDSSDPFVVLEAANDLSKRRATGAIPKLRAIDIRKNAHSAPSVIDALGRLAAAADPADRRTATDRLLELLAQERVRGAPESAGNVLSLYTALGQTAEPRAATALEGELLDPKVTLAAKVVIVEALVRLKQPSSVPALRALQRELSTLAPTDPLEEEIRRELTAAVARALQP